MSFYLMIQGLVTVDRIYPIVLEIVDATDTNKSVSYLELHLKSTID